MSAPRSLFPGKVFEANNPREMRECIVEFLRAKAAEEMFWHQAIRPKRKNSVFAARNSVLCCAANDIEAAFIVSSEGMPL